MPDRRPVWLSEEAWDRISDVLKGNGFGYGDHVVDEFWEEPVPWLTVNDDGQPVRMVSTCSVCGGSGRLQSWECVRCDGTGGSSSSIDLYRAVPVDQDGGGDA